MIERAQIKKEYAKLKRQGKIPETKEELPKPASAHLDEREDEVKERDFEGFSDDAGDENPGQSSAAPHPDRQTLMDREEADPGPEQREQRRDRQPRPSRERKPKHKPFEREHERANKRKEEAEARRKEREERERQREEKIEQRERIRKAMAKARAGGRNGQRRLGRESNVLLEKVKMMVGGK